LGRDVVPSHIGSADFPTNNQVNEIRNYRSGAGVVFGDIGTSPIYTFQTIFNPDDPHPVPITTDNVYGVVSMIFWSVMIIVTLTYVMLVMHADNDGEGGIMALVALVPGVGTA
jgi:KUP system potassium uptake protein